jgi:sugar O-acyltransferase (sialic acid O-acetyltransferase NeuD family)
LHAWINGSPRYIDEQDVSDIVFIDDAVPEVEVPAPVLATVYEYLPLAEDVVLCAVGIPRVRRQVVETLTQRGAVFSTFIDDRAVIGSNVSIGKGSIVCPGSVITSDIELGEQVHININCSIGHDVRIGDFATMSPACSLMGGVIVEDDVFMGVGATVIPRKRLVARSVVGAGSVVVKNVPSDVTSFGNPSRTISKR